MDYEYIENLVIASKSGNQKAKETLALEFTPLINSICRRTFIYGYERSDIRNECFTTLFYCVHKYKLEAHRFIAYATNGIKNNINDLIKKTVKQNGLNNFLTLSLYDDALDFLPSNENNLEETLCLLNDYNELSYVINNKLNTEEKQLISFLFFNKNTLTSYANHEKISYVAASKRKKKVLNKLKNNIDGGNDLWQLMI
ncbi:sigma-70 family RNA polymerase sigma factor [Clostridium sp. C2-6-12]|uniref:sigma-70 family RNA polymerase sigma factor n=1 Tax=Clostridium sp. C2-6-12 TaxID=2698832 RepID=UPI00136C8F9A|nr:sigma-70 family RNA polymerase sigma factor [Clostridium sp. C2-6-12]